MVAPWISIGDFNSIFSYKDKHNDDFVSNYDVLDFRKCCADLGFVDLNYFGFHFTWYNNNTWSRIDRVMVNPFWYTLQKQAHVHFGNPGASLLKSLMRINSDRVSIDSREMNF